MVSEEHAAATLVLEEIDIPELSVSVQPARITDARERADSDPTGLRSGGGTLLATGWEGGEVRGNQAGDLRPLRALQSLARVHVGGIQIEDLAMPFGRRPPRTAPIDGSVGRGGERRPLLGGSLPPTTTEPEPGVYGLSATPAARHFLSGKRDSRVRSLGRSLPCSHGRATGVAFPSFPCRPGSRLLFLLLLVLVGRVGGLSVGVASTQHTPALDFESLRAAGNTHPIGLWGDARTLWVVDNGNSKLYAYDRASRERAPARDIDVAEIGTPTGLWSDGSTIWVLSAWGGALAYDLASGARMSSLDRPQVGVLGEEGSAMGLWADGETAWVGHTSGTVAAYEWASGQRQAARDFTTLAAAGNRDVQGLWSDGETMWVADLSNGKLYAYRGWPPVLTSLDLSGIQIGPFDRFQADYVADLDAPPAETTVTATPGTRASLEVLPSDADPVAPGHQVDLSSLQEGESLDVTLTVSSQSGLPSRTYTVEIRRPGHRSDARLGELRLSGVNYGPFDRNLRLYRAAVGAQVAVTTVSATPLGTAASTQVEGTDADPDAPGHQVHLAVGVNRVTVKVTAQDGTTTHVYTVEVTRPRPSRDARLLSLSLEGIDFGTFSSDTLEYATEDGLGLTTTTVTAEAAPGASFAVTPPDAEAAVSGHQIALPPRNDLSGSVTVTAGDGTTTRVYRTDLSRSVATIPDVNLSEAVKLALDIPLLEPIPQTALRSLGVLDVSRSEVTSLAGLEGALNLRELFLGSNRIADLSPLAGLPVTVRYTHSPGLRNQEWSEDDLWRPVAILPSLRDNPIGHGRGFMADGHLVLIRAHDGPRPLEFPARVEVWDMSNPRRPRLVKAHADLPRRLREAHGFGLWNRDGQIVLAAQTHRGVAFYEVTEISKRLTLLGELDLFGELREGYAGSWWVAMQAPYAYVGAIGGGLYVVDASDPSSPSVVRHLETGELGGISPGSVFAVGGLLVLAEAGNRGFATMDISDPANPSFIDARDGATSYSHMFTAGLVLSSGGDQGPGRMYVHRVGHDGHIVYAGEAGHRLWDGGYGAYKDGHFFSGFSINAAKFSIDPPAQVGKGSSDVTGRDEDFVSPLGNLLFVGDDHGVGSSLMPHQAERDTSGPEVEWVHPADGATGVAATTAIGVSMSEEVGIESLTADRFRVRPRGGEPVSGQLSASLNNLNFVPDSPLAPGTVYEVEVCGLSDLVGNAGGCDTSIFTTRDPGSDPPVCRLGPFEAVEVGTAVEYLPASAIGEPEAYTWNFGDGRVTGPQPAAQATTTYAAPGRYTVTLTVTNPSGKSSCGAVRIVHNPLTAAGPTAVGAPVSSSSIAVDFKLGRENRAGDPLRYTHVYVVNRDNDSVSRISTSDDRAWTPDENAWETAVGESPRTLAVAPDRKIWVACQGSGEIVVLNRDGVMEQIIDLGYGAAPYGVVFAPDGSAAYVTLAGSGRLLKLTPGGAIAGDLAIGPHPRGVAVSGDSSRIFVTRFVSGYAESDGSGSGDAIGELYEVDAASFTVVRTLELAFDPGPDRESSGRGVPNYLSQVRIAPDGRTAWIPSKKDNIARGVQRDGNQLDFETQTRAIVSQVDLVANAETLDRRIDFNDRDLPQSMVFTPAGDAFIVAFQGSNVIEVWDANARRRMSQLPVGRAPDGIAMRPDGRRLYVHNFLDRSVSIFDTAGLLDGTSSQPIPVAVVATVGEEALEPAVLRGKRIFYNAADTRMNRDGYISCASCHLDGGSDGMVWDRTQFGEGLRNTIDLRGRRGTNGGFVHWTANFDEIQDFEHDMRGSFGGTGFMDDTAFAFGTRNDPLGDSKAGLSAELDDLAAYLTSLAEYPDSPYRQDDGSLTEAGTRGKAVFQARQCVLCHQGPDFTDDGTHNVGTLDASSGLASGGLLEGINTPTLKGLWESAPYLHNGAAATLAEVLGNALHVGGELTAQEETDLEAYLLQIDRNEDAGTGEPLDPGTLRELLLSGVDIGVFDSDKKAYRGSVGGDVATTTVTAVASEANAAVEITPPDADALESGHQVRLGEGVNAIAVKVTAEDGQTNTTYTVTVIRLMIPLTASFASLPDAHRGSGTVSLQIQFSEPVGTSYLTLRDSSFAVTNGNVRSAGRVNGRDDLWKINIAPSSSKAVLVALPATDDCAATGAICTPAGKRLSHGLQAVIQGPVLPRISISATAATVTEGTPAAFDFILDDIAHTDLTIAASVTESGSVLASLVPPPVTIAAGHTSATLNLPTAGDLEAEADSTVTVTVTGGPGYTVGEDTSASVTVQDDDLAVFAVSAAPETIAEGESATLTVAISNGVTLAEDQSIEFGLSGTASVADYTLTPPTLTLAPGASSVTAELAAAVDQQDEEDETLTVAVSLGGVTVGSATVTIRSVSHDATLNGLSLSGIDIGTFSDEATSYTARVEHSVETTTVTAMASHPEASVSIQPGPDASLSVGANEIAVTVTAEDGTTTKTYTVTVRREGPALTASFLDPPERHAGSGTFSLRVLFSEPVSVSYSVLRDQSLEVTNGGVSGARRVNGRDDLWEIVIAPSSDAEVTVALPATADCAAPAAVCTEDGRPLSQRLEAVVPGPSRPEVSIGALSSPVTEGTAAEFTVTLGEAAAEALTVSVSVTESGSVLAEAPPTELTFAAGETSVALSVPTAGDAVVEGDSTVTATVTAGTGYAVGAASSAAVTVEDDDAATFTVSAAPDAISEGEGATLTVAIANGVTFAEDQSIESGLSGTASAADYTLTPPTLTLAPGASSVTAELAAAVDQEDEEDETLTVAVSLGGVTVGSATVTIRSVSHDATLNRLSLSGIDIGTFSDEATSYTARVEHSARIFIAITNT